MDTQLRRALKAYRANPNDQEAVSRLAAHAARSLGGEDRRPTDPWNVYVFNQNKAEVTAPDVGRILFSYGTPVAAILCDGQRVWSKEAAYSATSSKHVGQWLEKDRAENVSADRLRELIA